MTFFFETLKILEIKKKNVEKENKKKMFEKDDDFQEEYFKNSRLYRKIQIFGNNLDLKETRLICLIV